MKSTSTSGLMTTVACFVIGLATLFGPQVVRTPWKSADALAAPAVSCPAGAFTDEHKPFTFTAPAGQVVTSVCIKAGQVLFNCNSNGMCSGCYDVTGIGTATVAVNQAGIGGCKDIGTVTFYVGADQSATLVVTVIDGGTQAPVPGASVAVEFTGGLGGTFGFPTDGNGQYAFGGLLVGVPFTLTADDQRGRTQTVQGSGLASGSNAILVTLPALP